MSHNVTAHVVLGIILFILSTIVFDGYGLYSSVLLTTAEVSGTLMSSGTNFEQDAARIGGLVPIVVAVIVNIVVYYVAAGIIIFLFSMFGKKQ